MDSEWLGYAGAAVLTSMSLPQIAKILHDRSAVGVSLSTWSVFAVSGSSWLAYGLILDAPAVIVGNVAFVATTLPVVMLLLLRQRQWPAAAALGLPPVAAAAGVGFLAQMPAVVPSALGIACGVLSTAPQLVESVRRRRAGLISEVSLGTLGLLLTGQSLWLMYGLARPAPPIVITNLLAVGVTVALLLVEGGSPARRR